jgi:hypothetical protein
MWLAQSVQTCDLYFKLPGPLGGLMKLKELVDKVMANKEWYQQLKTDPAEFSRINKLDLDEKEIDALKKINYDSLDDVAQAFQSWKA